MHNPNVLIIRLSSIGDILLSTPFLRQIRFTFPHAKIDYIVKDKFQDLLIHNPHVNELIVFNPLDQTKDLSYIKKHIRKVRYDYIFDLHNNWRSNYLRFGLKAKHVDKIKKEKLKQIALVYCKKNLYKRVLSIPQRYFRVGNSAGIKEDQQGLEIYWNKREEEVLDRVLNNHKITLPNKYICIAPGASFFTKRWPKEYFEQLISDIYKQNLYDIVILGGMEEIDLAEYLARNQNIINLVGKLGLIQNAIILSKSIAMISNDSGLMHMATAVKTPVLTIFGPSVRELGFFPYHSKHIMVENDNLSCRPCSHIGKHYCPKKHFRCMLDISPSHVMTHFKELIQHDKDGNPW